MSAASKEAWPEIPDDESSIDLPPIIALDRFLEVPLELPEELVDGLIRKNSVVMFASGSKSYKTWTLLHLALCVSQGLPWLGRKVTKGRVLFLNFELSPAELQSRLMAITQTLGIGSTPNFDICNLRGHATDIARLMPEVIKRCEGKDYAMIIPDPIYSMMGERNENAANEMADFLNHLSKLSEATGAAVVYTHHYAKGNAAAKDSMDRASGSGVFARHADGIVTMTRHEENNAYVVDADLRSFPRLEPFTVRWEFPVMKLAEELDPTRLRQKAGRKPLHTPEHLLECLAKDGMTAGEWAAAAKAQHFMSQSTFYELRDKAEGTGLVEKREKKWFRNPKVPVFDPMTDEVKSQECSASRQFQNVNTPNEE